MKRLYLLFLALGLLLFGCTGDFEDYGDYAVIEYDESDYPFGSQYESVGLFDQERCVFIEHPSGINLFTIENCQDNPSLENGAAYLVSGRICGHSETQDASLDTVGKVRLMALLWAFSGEPISLQIDPGISNDELIRIALPVLCDAEMERVPTYTIYLPKDAELLEEEHVPAVSNINCSNAIFIEKEGEKEIIGFNLTLPHKATDVFGQMEMNQLFLFPGWADDSAQLVIPLSFTEYRYPGDLSLSSSTSYIITAEGTLDCDSSKLGGAEPFLRCTLPRNFSLSSIQGIVVSSHDFENNFSCISIFSVFPPEPEPEPLCPNCPECEGNDTDTDCIPNDIDNCPLTFNPLQLDYDKDGLGDACDAASVNCSAICKEAGADYDYWSVPAEGATEEACSNINGTYTLIELEPANYSCCCKAWNAPKLPEEPEIEIKYYLMSTCPFADSAHDALADTLAFFGNCIYFEPVYIYYDESILSAYNADNPECIVDNNSGEVYCAMHGRYELNQNIREKMVFQRYGALAWAKYVSEVDTRCDPRNIATCWKTAADGMGIDSSEISLNFNSEKFTILSHDKSLAQSSEHFGSPALVINGKDYSGERTHRAYKNAISRELEIDYIECR